MTALLPQGFINANTVLEQRPAEDSDVTNSEILRRFWRVYDAESHATRDHASTRSCNLFWRVWSSPTLSQSISVPRLTRLWRQCGEDFNLTPIGHQLSIPHGSPPQEFSAPRSVRNRSSSLSPTSGIRPTLDSDPRAGQDIEPILREYSFPPAHTATPTVDRGPSTDHRLGPRQQGRVEASSSNVQPGASSMTRPTVARVVSSGRSKPLVAATVGKSRTRPQPPRRKSSSQKGSTSVGSIKSPRGSQETPSGGTASQEAMIAPAGRRNQSNYPPGLPIPATTSGPVFVLPSASSWQSVDSTVENIAMASTAPVAAPPGELVDRDFRGRFVENQRKLVSSTNLAALTRMKKSGSVVRFAEDMPRDLRKGKEREILPQRSENAGPSQLRYGATSMTVSIHDNDTENEDDQERRGEGDDDDDDDDDDDADDQDEDEDGEDDSSDDGPSLQLPRSKSQLSLLIKSKRNETGSQDIGPSSQPEYSEAKARDKDNERAKARAKEEELLSMGRQGGVTKAGGVQVPKTHRVSDQSLLDDMPPSSPEPLF